MHDCGCSVGLSSVLRRLDSLEEEVADLRMIVTQPQGAVRFFDPTEIRDHVGEEDDEG